MKKKSFLGILSFFLAIVMAVVSPAQVIATTADREYIKELRIGYGESGKATLEKENYKILTDKKGKAVNANETGTAKEGSTDGAVYIGYKTTTNKEEAVTDIALMPMGSSTDRDYSFDLYTDEIDNINQQVNEILANFDTTVQEFRRCLAAGNKYAKCALELLNTYKEDDTGMKIGDLLALSEYTASTITAAQQKEALHRIFMEGNSTVINAIFQVLAMGCTVIGDSFLDRLNKQYYTRDIDTSDNLKRVAVSSAIASLRDTLTEAQEYLAAYESFDGDFEAFIESIDEISQYSVANAIYLYQSMDKINYGDVLKTDESHMSFAEAILLPDTYSDDYNGPVMTDYMVDVLARSLTDGQVGLLPRIGLVPIIQTAINAGEVVTDKDGNEVKGSTEYIEKTIKDLKSKEVMSVYIGVDRSIFHDYKTIAITSQAIQEQSASGGLARKAEYEEVVNGRCLTVGIGATIFAAFIGLAVIAPMVRTAVKYMEYAWFDGNFIQAMINTKVLVPSIIAGIVFIASLVLAIIEFVNYRQTVEKAEVTYTQIPRAIIDVKYITRKIGTSTETKTFYIPYYAATLAGSDNDYKNQKDTTKLYGDLNGMNGLEPWLCLYYANDLRLGSPLTPDELLVKSTGKLTAFDSKQYKNYVPIHSFRYNFLEANKQDYAAFDLNQISQSPGHSSIYVFFLRDVSVNPVAASIFSDSTALIVTGAFLAGAILTALTSVIIVKNKAKKRQSPAA